MTRLIHSFASMILVTGGTGFIGAHLLFDLVNRHKRVRALKRGKADIAFVKKVFSYYASNFEKLYNRIEWRQGDVLDIFSLEEALADVEAVFHCAGKVSFNPGDQHGVMKVNVEGTANLVNCILEKGIRKLCHVSSIAALGRTAPEEYIDENTHWKTSKRNSIYAISKYGAEREVWRGIEEGLQAVIVNPSVVIGPGDWNQGSSRFIQTVWKGLKVYTTGINGFVDVRDVSQAMISLMESKLVNERFILNAENLCYRDLLFKIADQLGKKRAVFKAGKALSELAWRTDKLKSMLTGIPPFITRETARTAVDNYHYSNKKIKTMLGFAFRDMDETIKNTCKLFLKDMYAKE